MPRARIAETLASLERVKGAEAAMLARVRTGLKEIPLAAELLEGGRIRSVDS